MRWLSALFLSVLLAFSMSAVSVAGPDDPGGGEGALKAWTGEVSPEVVDELRSAGFEITGEDVVDEDTGRGLRITRGPLSN